MSQDHSVRRHASKTKSRAARVIGQVAGALLLLFVLAIGALAVVIPGITKSIPLTVLTSSMEPDYPPGTLLVIRPVAVDNIVAGDIVTFQVKSGEPEVITHRVISITIGADGERRFTTKGDNNPDPDDNLVRAAQIQGELWYSIPYLGWVNQAVSGEARNIVIPVLAGLLFAYAGVTAALAIRDRVRSKRHVEPDSQDDSLEPGSSEADSSEPGPSNPIPKA